MLPWNPIRAYSIISYSTYKSMTFADGTDPLADKGLCCLHKGHFATFCIFHKRLSIKEVRHYGTAGNDPV